MTVFVRDNGLEGAEHEIEFVDCGGLDEYYAELFLLRDGESRILGLVPRRMWKEHKVLIPFEQWLGPDDFFVQQKDSNCAHVSAMKAGKAQHFRLNMEMWGTAPAEVMLPVFKTWRAMYRKGCSTAFARAAYLVTRAKGELETFVNGKTNPRQLILDDEEEKDDGREGTG